MQPYFRWPLLNTEVALASALLRNYPKWAHPLSMKYEHVLTSYRSHFCTPYPTPVCHFSTEVIRIGRWSQRLQRLQTAEALLPAILGLKLTSPLSLECSMTSILHGSFDVTSDLLWFDITNWSWLKLEGTSELLGL